ncbi:hypothetical protein [Clostridium septicum]|uniref:DUF2802 domain-containing protein n=1 Tax=Clostridium septicum TaxID=1504 RepID=A0A9N7JK88_CLOSE|nr:hypothetical protein [Clostridium septicum]AYE33411.1 hypothetical protein CP523_02505 [Clostridium septicum]MDU1313980.1 hypothetical protein [Clostridium septicum]QAS61585.1 hypothetical protein EI377_13040 [Clostridium septicum]UEC21979.1 hypothetical protein LK444_06360 [Clostridium septicum]USR99989.1 hypothetical protein NH397_10835 [Clostridium septicum]
MIPVLILIIGILLIGLNLKVIKKEDNSFNDILKREENNNNRDYDLEIISIRKDMAESILDIQKEMESMKISIENIKKTKEKDDNNSENVKLYENGVISNIKFPNNLSKKDKTEQVKALLKQGLSDEEVCEKLSIGRGEVLLIKGLL